VLLRDQAEINGTLDATPAEHWQLMEDDAETEVLSIEDWPPDTVRMFMGLAIEDGQRQRAILDGPLGIPDLEPEA